MLEWWQILATSATGLGALVTAVAAIVWQRRKTEAEIGKIVTETTLLAQDIKSDTHMIRHEVKNNHSSNIREDLDDVKRILTNHDIMLENEHVNMQNYRIKQDARMDRYEEQQKQLIEAVRDIRGVLARSIEYAEFKNEEKVTKTGRDCVKPFLSQVARKG